MIYLTYLTLLALACLSFIVMCFYVGNAFENELRKQHRKRQLKQQRAEMQRQYAMHIRALNHNNQIIKELNK